MILLFGSSAETIIPYIHEVLQERKAEAVFIEQSDLPHTVKINLEGSGNQLGGYFLLADGRKVDIHSLTSIYARPGYGYYEVFEDYTQPEIDFINMECNSTLSMLLEYAPCLVLNRPSASASNASKPHQIKMIRSHGFSVPKTVVSNDQKIIREFYEACGKSAVYKSISSVRSIVKKMTDEDLSRLSTLRNCPIQVQEYVEGQDVRVHVVDQECFAVAIVSGQSDYRYDQETSMQPFDLPDDVRQKCLSLSKGLNLPLTGIDLRRTPAGQYYCFEANPSPVHSYFERHAYNGKKPITEALCRFLARGLKAAAV